MTEELIHKVCRYQRSPKACNKCPVGEFNSGERMCRLLAKELIEVVIKESGRLSVQQYNLIHQVEECSEVIKAATKALRFGLDDTNPKTGNTNAEDLREELGDVANVADILVDCGVIEPIDHEAREHKKAKGKIMAEYSRSRGILGGESGE